MSHLKDQTLPSDSALQCSHRVLQEREGIGQCYSEASGYFGDCETKMKSGESKKGCTIKKREGVAHLLHCQEQCQRSLRMAVLLESF